MSEFDKIIGYENEKTELIRLCNVISNREKYLSFGIKIPQALLIYGEPGLGKTLMAEAFIKESKRKCFSCKKDKPDGKFVSEIAAVFDKATENQPSIVFLDDMDKFAEDNLNIDCNKEEFVTVQTCLEKIKGQDVFVIATANNIRNLPESLLRSGRFGRQIKVGYPQKKDAVKIISHYLSNKKISNEIKVETLADILNKKSCAVLESVINEAGIYAVYSGFDEIKMDHIKEAVLRVVLETIETERENPENERLVAYHEAGHAVMSVLADKKVGIVTIKKFGDTGGICRQYGYSKTYEGVQEFKNEIMIILAGKAAVEIQFNESDMGVESDMLKLSGEVRYALESLCLYGFDYLYDQNDYSRKQSAERNDKVIQKMTDIIKELYEECKNMLIENKQMLDAIAGALLEKKVLIWDDVEAIVKSTAGKNS